MQRLHKFCEWVNWQRVTLLVIVFLLVKLAFAFVFHTESIAPIIFHLFFYLSGVISGIGLLFASDRRKRRVPHHTDFYKTLYKIASQHDETAEIR